MKKFFTFLFAGLLTVGLSAQTEQGTMMISGATGLDYLTVTLDDVDPGDLGGMESSGSEMNLELLGGYFISDGFMGGLSVSYSTEGTEMSMDLGAGLGTMSQETSTSSMMIAPTVRYYIGESGLWAQAQYGFGTETSETTDSQGSVTNTVEDEATISSINIGAGYALYITENVSFNPAITYGMITHTVADGAYDSSGNVVDAVSSLSGISFSLGVAIHLGN